MDKYRVNEFNGIKLITILDYRIKPSEIVEEFKKTEKDFIVDTLFAGGEDIFRFIKVTSDKRSKDDIIYYMDNDLEEYADNIIKDIIEEDDRYLNRCVMAFKFKEKGDDE